MVVLDGWVGLHTLSYGVVGTHPPAAAAAVVLCCSCCTVSGCCCPPH